MWYTFQKLQKRQYGVFPPRWLIVGVYETKSKGEFIFVELFIYIYMIL